MAQRRQAPIGIVMPQQQAVLGAAGEHAIRLVDAAGDEVVDHHAQVGFVAAKDQGIASLQRQCRVGAGQQSLGGRLFVARGAVELSGQVEPGDLLGFQGGLQLIGRDEIVFDGIAVADDLRPPQARDRAATWPSARRAAGWSKVR